MSGGWGVGGVGGSFEAFIGGSGQGINVGFLSFLGGGELDSFLFKLDVFVYSLGRGGGGKVVAGGEGHWFGVGGGVGGGGGKLPLHAPPPPPPPPTSLVVV